MKNSKNNKPLRIYKIDKNYIKFLEESDTTIFHDTGSRVYIGVILNINDLDYFAPLSSFKDKHYHMSNLLDLIKIKNYAVVNLNNMIPVSKGIYQLFDINNIKNDNYKNLLQREVREINRIRHRIIKNANYVYNHKLRNKNSTPLAMRCNDFKKLERKANQFKKRKEKN